MATFVDIMKGFVEKRWATRESWPGGRYIYICGSFIYVQDGDTIISQWIPRKDDMVATDWVCGISQEAEAVDCTPPEVQQPAEPTDVHQPPEEPQDYRVTAQELITVKITCNYDRDKVLHDIAYVNVETGVAFDKNLRTINNPHWCRAIQRAVAGKLKPLCTERK